MIVEYKDDLQVGFTRTYYKNGNIKSEEEYNSEGNLVNDTYYTWSKRGEKYMHKGKYIEGGHHIGRLHIGGGRTKYIKTNIKKQN